MNSQEKLQFASLILGITSLAFLLFGLSLPLGALGLILALLSRGNGEPIQGRAVAGMITSLIGLVFGAVILIATIYMIHTGVYDELLKQFNSYYSQSAGTVIGALQEVFL